jgi:hypothetical protein
MKALHTMKTVKTALLAAGIAFTMACGYSHSMTPATPGTTPVINALNPDNVNHGTATFPLVVNGTSFNNNAFITITMNGTASKMTTTVGGTSNASTATAMIPASVITNAGMAQVTVTNPGTQGTGPYGGGGTTTVTSLPKPFTVN